MKTSPIISAAILAFSTFFGLAVNAHAQVKDYSFSSSPGTFTPLAAGDTISPMDCALFTNYDIFFKDKPIGFSFNFNGTDYTTVGIHSNGFIWFGSGNPALKAIAPLSTDGNLGGTGTVDGVVAVMGKDIDPQFQAPCGGILMATTGTGGDRICTIQYSNYRNAQSGTGAARYTFQVALHEGTNLITFHYGPVSPSTKSVPAQVGLRGLTNADFNSRFTKTDWDLSKSSATVDSTLEVSDLVNPAPGETFTWIPNPTSLRGVADRNARVTFPGLDDPQSEIFDFTGRKWAAPGPGSASVRKGLPRGIYFVKTRAGLRTLVKE